ncbi:cytochrome P450 [Aspergillus indologenus CBS 114.80]|uniref:Cytochrome P450 n=1 Tax=Aspergillus indologenus CBS 114.80 TaxID=1450541 RepID=A0A2V5HQP6_9EURO|nr:cytochrome P450 [Aspergillus indologenus CBS 114.80]
MLDLADSAQVPDQVRKWFAEYGDIFYTRIGGTDYVWLSSPRAVKDLMDNKFSIYSSRPRLPLAQDVASAGRRQLFMEYGPQWRGIRKFSHSLLNAQAAINYQPVQDFESLQLMFDLLETPADFYEHNRRYSASVIMRVTYGYRLPTWKHPLVHKIYSVLDNLTEMTAPGAHAVDSFPNLQYIPQWLLGNWKTFARRVFDHDSQVYLGLWAELKRQVDQGTAADCFCKSFYLKDPAKAGIDNLAAAYTCGGLVEAGSETTATTLNNWLLAMALNPAVVQRAQQEIDRVVGPDRLPSWEDEASLPYVRAIIKETLRWRPVNKFGMMHATSDDDWYDGYFIPKGSVVILNWWAIHRNPELHANPDEFQPERYLAHPLSAAEYINVADPYQRDHFTYGAGRRICPGVHVAERSLYINIARTLWGFKIGKKTEADGQIIEPTTAMVRGFLSIPHHFACAIEPRSAHHAQLIRDAWKSAEAETTRLRA